MRIRQQLTSTKNSYGRKNKKLFITVHQTGNTSKGANAAAHANLQSRGNVRAAAWHWQVDDKEAVQSFTHDWQLFHAGDGRGNGNLTSIAIEMCVNSDGDYNAALANLKTLIKKIMKDEGIPASRVVQHNHWSGKNCPSQIRSRGQWKGIKDAIETKPVSSKPTPAPSKPKPKPKNDIDEDGLWGKDTTSLLQKVLGTYVDGIVSSQSNVWKKSNPGLTTGWDWVASSKAKGSPVIRAHQKILKGRGHYKGKIDGKAGVEYFKAIQRDVKTHVDGEIWRESPAIKKFQARLNKGKV